MQKAGAKRVSQRALSGHRRIAWVNVPGNAGKKREIRASFCTAPFLRHKIEIIEPSGNDVLYFFGIDVAKSFYHILASMKRFCKTAGLKFDFKADRAGMNDLNELVDYCQKVIEPLGLEMNISRPTEVDDWDGLLDCCLYRYGKEMDYTILVMYVSPADYLSPQSAELFKKWMSFFSFTTSIHLGFCSDNMELECIMDMHDENEFDEEEAEEYYGISKDVFQAYKEGGKFEKLMQEIYSKKCHSPASLHKEISDYLERCPEEEKALFEVILEGIPIVDRICIYDYDYNPFANGFPDEYGNTYEDEYNSTVQCSAILYSEQDGIGEMMIENINSNTQGGIEYYGFNLFLNLTPKTKKDSIRWFINSRDEIKVFSEWYNKYYEQATKFDKYGRREESA